MNMVEDTKNYDWQGVIAKYNGAEKIPEEPGKKAAYALGRAYFQGLRADEDKVKWWHLAKDLFLRLAAEEKSPYVCGKLATLYGLAYDERPFIEGLDKKDALAEALAYYEDVYAMGAEEYDLYQYASLLYKSSSAYGALTDVKERRRLREKAYFLYKEIVEGHEAGEFAKKSDRAYIRSAYGLCRCGLDLYGSQSTFQKECTLLCGKTVVSPLMKEQKRDIFKTLCHAVEAVRRYEDLPCRMESPCALREQTYSYEAPWDIYYILGRIFEFAVLYDLLPDRQEGITSCIKYYTYVCEIDRDRRTARLPVSGFTHMYKALLEFYLFIGDEENVKKCLVQYKDYIEPHRRALTKLRLHLRHGKYEEVLMELDDVNSSLTGLSPQKKKVLRQLTQALYTQNAAPLATQYKPYDMKLYALAAQKKLQPS